MGSSPFLRLLSLLLLLLPAPLREYYHYLPASPSSNRKLPGGGDDAAAAAVNNADELHPIILVPGGSCSELEARLTDAYRPSTPRCGAMKGKGWFGLWHNSSDLPAHHYVSCFMEQMSLVYDPDANDYRNVDGVETRVLNFGTSTGFHSNPLHPDWCLETLRHELERIGYRDGATLFGAPYDLRRVPPIPGQPSRFYADYFRRLTALVEEATAASSGKKAILFGHSFGGAVALEFLRAAPAAWRDAHVKHLVLAAPLPASGLVSPVKYFVSGIDFLQIPGTTALTLRPMWRSFESALIGFPSPSSPIGGDADTPVVVTRRRNYTARDMEDLLADVGARGAVEPYRRRQLPRARCCAGDQPPMVPVTCVNGVGLDTPERLSYWDGDFDKPPEVTYGDGDDSINLAAMLAFDEEMRRHPWQRERYKTIKLPGVTHGTILTAEWSLKRVVHEILEANNNRV